MKSFSKETENMAVIDLNLGYQLNSSLGIGWGLLDNDILYQIMLQTNISYANVNLGITQEETDIKEIISKKEWNKRFRMFNDTFYQSTRLSFYADSSNNYMPISLGLFLYGNSFHNMTDSSKNFANKMWAIGIGMKADLGWVFFESLKIQLGAEFMPNFLRFYYSKTPKSRFKFDIQYEISAGLRYSFNENISIYTRWHWGRIKAKDFIHFSSRIEKLKSVEATIYHNFVIGMQFRIF